MTDQIWLKNYPPGVPHSIDPAVYPSLVELFEQACDKFADKPAVSNFGTQLTFRQLSRLSEQFAAYLQQELGFVKGDRFAIMLPNTLQYYVAMFGALRAGLTVVNVNPLYTAEEVVQQLNDAGAQCLVVMANFVKTVEKAVPLLPLKQVIVTEIGDLFPAPKAFLYNAVSRYVKRLVPAYHLPEAVTFRQVLQQGKQLRFSRVIVEPEDVAYLQYTGGTTGVPKGAVLTHRNMVANVAQALAWVKGLGLNYGEEILIAPLPLYHIFSLTVSAFCFLELGGLTVLITNPRDIPNFVKELKKTSYSVFVGINTLFHALLKHPEFLQLSFAKLKLTITGGMALQEHIDQGWHEVTKQWILQGYGLTEASPIVAINPGNIYGFNGSIGLPLPSTDVVIRDENNQDMPLGQEGELCVKGPQVMRGYWHNESETQLAFTEDGWLKTGDIARLDDQGFIYIVDRKKDMIIVSGFKIYPNEVENVIVNHPGVHEVAVIGIPSHDASGEKVKAFVVRQDANLTADGVIAFCREHLTRYKVPHEIEFVSELPKSNVGKILRRKLR